MNKRITGFLMIPVALTVAACLITQQIDLNKAGAQSPKAASIASSLPTSSATSNALGNNASPIMQSNGPAGIRAIDVSHHDTITDWNTLKTSIDAIYIKATEGVTYIDPTFDAYASAAIARGIPTGFYHFFWPNADVAVARQQADHFYAAIKIYHYALYPVLDVEETNNLSPQAIAANVKAFSDEFKKVSGQQIMLYSSPNFADKYLSDKGLSNYPLWVAHYDVHAPQNTTIWHNYEIWQYGTTASVPGVSGLVDSDIATANIFLDTSKAPKQQGTVSTSTI